MQTRQRGKDVTIIGPAIIDVLAAPVSPQVFQTGSQPVERMKLSFGGDALNEAVVLSRLGKSAELISKVGQDEAGARVLAYLEENGLTAEKVKVEPGLVTGMNVVLVAEDGQRHFLTDPKGSLRALALEDVEPHLEDAADLVSFASLFISHRLGLPELERLFRQVKARPGRVLVLDMTKAKRGERLEDLAGLLPWVDYVLPNEEEAALLTGEKDPLRSARRFVEAGAGCAVIKCGAQGCLIHSDRLSCRIPAYPVERCVDSTGAGDCFAAGFLWGLSEGLSLPDCGRFACAAASCSVEHIGAVEGVTSLEQVRARYRRLRELG